MTNSDTDTKLESRLDDMMDTIQLYNEKIMDLSGNAGTGLHFMLDDMVMALISSEAEQLYNKLKERHPESAEDLTKVLSLTVGLAEAKGSKQQTDHIKEKVTSSKFLKNIRKMFKQEILDAEKAAEEVLKGDA